MNHSNSKDTLEFIQGSIESVLFYNEDSGFCILKIKVPKNPKTFILKGVATQIHIGEWIRASGNWISDLKYGLQFKAVNIQSSPPFTLEGIEKYLASGSIKGIGPHFAKCLVQTFGDKVLDIIENTPERLLELPGIGPKRYQQVLEAWKEQRIVRDIIVFLQSYGIGSSRAVRIYKTYGNQAIEWISANPYRLAADISGIGFKTADSLAQKLGIDPDARIRACAGIQHVLQELASVGHCAIPKSMLIEEAIAILKIPASILEDALLQEMQEGKIIAEEQGNIFYLNPLYQAEKGIAEHCKRLMQAKPKSTLLLNKNIEEQISKIEKEKNFFLSLPQKQAIIDALKNKFFIITGGPGVGKTTILKVVLDILSIQNIQFTLCAPTGRAAQRMMDTTGKVAKTLHRLLEFNPSKNTFKYNMHNPLPTDYVVVDEVSMVDIVLFYHLLKAIPNHAGILLLGDTDQLPPVGPGSALLDFLDSGSIPFVRLTEIFRQAQTSAIITNAHRINNGQFPITSKNSDFYYIAAETPEEIQNKLLKVVIERIPQHFHWDPISQIQVLTPMQKGGLGAQALNILLQSQLNKDNTFSVTRYGSTYNIQDKVIQLTNNYDKEVFNGDIGFITEIDYENAQVAIRYNQRLVLYDFNELDEIQLAYAITVHKSQGSEYPAIVMPIAMQHYTLLQRNVIYTAVTRAKNLVVLIGSKKALAIAIRQKNSCKRLTKLAKRLQEEGKK